MVKKSECCWKFCTQPRSSESTSYCLKHLREYNENYKFRVKCKKSHVMALNADTTVIEQFAPKQNDIDENEGSLPITWGKETWEYWGTKYSAKNWRYKFLK